MKKNLTRKTRRTDDSPALKEEIESKQGEILTLKDKLQGAKTTLLDFQNRSREKFEEQQQELESYKSKMEDYKMRR